MANRALISPNYPPLIDPTRATVAFGDRALPRMKRELNDGGLLVRQRALMSLCDYLHDPEHIADAVRLGLTLSLKRLLAADDDFTVKQKAAECLYVLAGHAVGRDAIIKQGIIIPLSGLYDHDRDIVRKNAHMATEMIAEHYLGAEEIVGADLVPVLVEKMKVELDEIKVYILDTLHYCFRVKPIQGLDGGAMEKLVKLICHDKVQLRAKAARAIMDICVSWPGKKRALELDCMKILISLLRDGSPSVRAYAAGAIMNIAIITEGKHAAVNGGAILPLVDLVDDWKSEVRLYSIKALSILAQHPEGRNTLLNVPILKPCCSCPVNSSCCTQCQDVKRRGVRRPGLSWIQARLTDRVPTVRKAAQTAVDIITWTP